MDVTRHNFQTCLHDIKQELTRSTCQLIAIDTEFTGLSPHEDVKERFIDTLEERYYKVKKAGESFLITQFGLSIIHYLHEQQRFKIQTWNFYIFPHPYGTSDQRFLCQASSLSFLSQHGFDFNKFIKDGIPYLSLNKAEPYKERLKKKIENMKQINANKELTLDDAGQLFQQQVNEMLTEWINNGQAQQGIYLNIPARNGFFKMIVHETVQGKAKYLYSESTENAVQVRWVSNKIKKELIEARAQEMRDELDQAIGFSKVIDLLSKSRKPVIGHNGLLDFIYLFNQFIKPLPDTLAEFKTQLTTIFPIIYDTKHIALRSPLGSKLTSTSLSSLFEHMKVNVKPSPEDLLSSDPQFDVYRRAIQNAASDGKQGDLCHEAGFDAMMTAVCFLGLLAHDKNGKVWNEDGLYDFKTRMMDMEQEFKNRLNLMFSDEQFLDLNDIHQTIDRSCVYRVSMTTNDRKRRMQHVKLEELFVPPNKITRVVRENDRDAFVYVSEPMPHDHVDKKANELGVTVVSFDAYQQQRETTSSRQRNERNSFTQTIAPVEKEKEMSEVPEDDPSIWNRCTIQ